MDDAVIAVICAGVCVAAIGLIVVAPWRRVRAEPRLDDEVESRLLLGDDPAEIAAEADARRADDLANRPEPPVDLPSRLDAG